MGYTNYWNRTEKPITQEFVDAVKEVFEDCKRKGITLGDGWGEYDPIATTDTIEFNGTMDKELDCESFLMTNTETGFEFCKTREYPYDYAVKQVLKIAEQMGLVTEVEDDGPTKMITDAEYLS